MHVSSLVGDRYGFRAAPTRKRTTKRSLVGEAAAMRDLNDREIARRHERPRDALPVLVDQVLVVHGGFREPPLHRARTPTEVPRNGRLVNAAELRECTQDEVAQRAGRVETLDELVRCDAEVRRDFAMHAGEG